MKIYLKIALKNILINKKRSVIAAMALIYAVAFSLFLWSMMDTLINESDYNYIDYSRASLKILNKEYFKSDDYKENKSTKKGQLDSNLIDTFKDYNYTLRAEFPTVLSVSKDPFKEDGAYYSLLVGIQESDKEVFKTTNMIQKGNNLSFKQSEDDYEEVLIGAKLADDLQAEIGYTFIMEFDNVNESKIILDAKIVGIFKSPDVQVNSTLLMSLDSLQTYMYSKDYVFSEINIGLGYNLKKINEIKEELQNVLKNKDVEVLNYLDLTEEFTGYKQLEITACSIMLALLFFIAFIGIYNVTLMSIMQRTRDFSVLRCIGFSLKEVNLVVKIETALLGFLSCLAGIILGLFFVWLLNIFQIDLIKLMGNIYIGFIVSILRAVIKPYHIIITSLLAFLVCYLSALISLNKIKQYSIIEGLGNIE